MSCGNICVEKFTTVQKLRYNSQISEDTCSALPTKFSSKRKTDKKKCEPSIELYNRASEIQSDTVYELLLLHETKNLSIYDYNCVYKKMQLLKRLCQHYISYSGDEQVFFLHMEKSIERLVSDIKKYMNQINRNIKMREEEGYTVIELGQHEQYEQHN